MTFRADAPGVDESPLRGLVPNSTMGQEPSAFPHSMEWFYLPLSAVVTGPNTYDWSPLEEKLAALAGRGHRLSSASKWITRKSRAEFCIICRTGG